MVKVKGENTLTSKVSVLRKYKYYFGGMMIKENEREIVLTDVKIGN